MTAGHKEGVGINQTLAEAAQIRGWPMGVGSQRRELLDTKASDEWKRIRKRAPNVMFMSNIGITQVISTPIKHIRKLIDHLEAQALIVHLNPLQEALQQEGTPLFKGSWDALSKLCREVTIPVIAKEVGSGISVSTAKRLLDLGVRVIDVAGRGGTHWGRVEGLRARIQNPMIYEMSLAFGDWGQSTVESVYRICQSLPKVTVWASGGIRSGVDAAKLLALGARGVGLATPLLQAALQSLESLLNLMQRLEQELKIALFCLGAKSPLELNLSHIDPATLPFPISKNQ